MAALLCTLIFCLLSTTSGQLRTGFYSSRCPKAEKIVSTVVRKAFNSDPTMAPALLRLHFHDCFVQGCDGSILIEGINAEKKAIGHQGLRGFEVIEQAKAQLESNCPDVVSCADIVALAARDSVVLTGGPNYQVETGRRDGKSSNIKEAKNMPEVGDSIKQLKSKFHNKGLSDQDLVILSAAHTIGTTACFFMKDRLYNFQSKSGSDPSINARFLPKLKSQCPPNGDINHRLGMDPGSETKFDKQILLNIINGFAVLESDAKLNEDESTKKYLNSYLGSLSSSHGGRSFEHDFVQSIVKMGKIGVITGSKGEIRRICSAFN